MRNKGKFTQQKGGGNNENKSKITYSIFRFWSSK